MRKIKENDYLIDAPGIGKFRFAHETLADHIAISARYTELSKGQGKNNNYLLTLALFTATIEVLGVSLPEGWDNLADKEFTPELSTQLITVGNLLNDAVESFRDSAARDSQKARVESSENVPKLVPADV